MKVLKWVLSIIFVFILVAFIGIYTYIRSILPDYDGEMTIPGLNHKIEIIRDSYGMPHIYALTDEDAYFALGYCIAQDRLFQLDLMRRAARGRLAEILGENLVPVDKLFRTITAGKSFKDTVDAYSPETLDVLKAYTRGINYFIENSKAPLPIEFTILNYKPHSWRHSDEAAIRYYMAWDLNSAFSIELVYAALIDRIGKDLARDLFPDYPEGYDPIDSEGVAALNFLKTLHQARTLLGTEGGGASNSWVVSGKKSVTGQPILANDLHLGHGLPGIWYEAHLVTPAMNVSGLVLPGLPFVIVGANEKVAWGWTTARVDDSDFYLEKINPANPEQYEFMRGWADMTVKEEIIKIKGGEKIKFKIKLTRHGPIINDLIKVKELTNASLSMRWTAYDILHTTPFVLLSRAESIDDVEKAVEHFKIPGQNWVYADHKGNIGYWVAAGIPIREGFSGAVPVPGWDGKHEWNGYVPTAEQPNLRNPARGWIATANNKQVDHKYPYPISHYYVMPDRFVRIQELITQKEKFGVDDFEKMQADLHVVLAREWVPMMLQSLSDVKLSAIENRALSILKKWNYTASAEGIAPTVFHATINEMVANTFKNRLGDELYRHYIKNISVTFNAMRNLVARGNSTWFDDPDTLEVEGMGDVFVKSFKGAVRYLGDQMGSDVDDWIWGELHTLTFYHPIGKFSSFMAYFLNIGPFPTGGSIATVNPHPYRLTNPWEAYHGASMRYIIDFSNMKNSLRVIPAGISGNFMSPHYSDQTKLWLDGKYRPFVLDRQSVDEDARYSLTMLPN